MFLGLPCAPHSLLLLNKLDIRERFRSQLDSLVESVFTSVRDIDDLDNLGLQSQIEKIRLIQIVLKVGRTGEDKALNVDLVVGDEMHNGVLGHLAHIVVALLGTETGETESRLSSTSVLLGQIDRELLQHFASVSSERSKQSAVSVHDDKPEFGVRLEKFSEGLGVELVVTEVQGAAWQANGSVELSEYADLLGTHVLIGCTSQGKDSQWSALPRGATSSQTTGSAHLEGLKVNVDLLFLAFISEDGTAVHDKAVRWDLVIKLETLLSRGDGGQYGQPVDTGLDVGCCEWRARCQRPWFQRRVRQG